MQSATSYLATVAIFVATSASAVTFESFEFNDSNGTPLSGTANSANPGNLWFSEADGTELIPSEVNGGDFRITKDTNGLASNWLDIANVEAGQIYLIAEMSGWAFRQFDASEPNEQVRFGFLNDDTGNSGNTITAQMQIGRNADGNIELTGQANGSGATPISSNALLEMDQSENFTTVLELDKDTDTYTIFYKDGTSPSQVLGSGTVSSARAANSIRFAVNNNFGSTNVPELNIFDEQFLVDRIELSDTNPLSDFVELTVDRDSGAIILNNATGAALSGLESYSLNSAAGGLDITGWKSVTGNSDTDGDGSIDNDDSWQISSMTTLDLSESVIAGDGGTLASGQMVSLNLDGDSAWLQSPFEDVQLTLNFSGGESRTARVNFTGNGGNRFAIGDLDFDNTISAADFQILMAGAESDLSGLTDVEAYRLGDLDGDGVNSIADFGLFKELYEFNNGAGSFAAMVASVPEPGTATLIFILTLALAPGRSMLRKHSVQLFIAAVAVASFSATEAAILEDFTFDDFNGTLLADADNSANQGNAWSEDAADMTESVIQNGVYNIMKANDGFGTNYLQIDNIVSGKAWLVAEIAGWHFSSIVGPSEFDQAEPEQIRFAFLNNDTGTSGSTLTAQMQIGRTDTGGLELIGNRAGGGENIAGTASLPLTQSDPFTMVVELDEDVNEYSVYYKDGNGPFNLLGTARHDPDRDGNSIRFTANNNFGGTDEFFDIERIYLTDTNPIVDVLDPLTLQVDTVTGQLQIRNDSTASFTFDSYRITNTEGLNVTGWNSLGNQGIDAVDGPDVGATAGDGIGETWTEAGGADSQVLAESFLLGSSTLSPGEFLSLGAGFVPGSAENVMFEYRVADSGATTAGLISYVMGNQALPGDLNGDDAVNFGDLSAFVLALTNPDGYASQFPDLDRVARCDASGDGSCNFGDLQPFVDLLTGGSSSATSAAVPEPGSILWLCFGGLALLFRRGSRSHQLHL